MEHVTSRVSAGGFRIKQNTPNPNLYFWLFLIVFHNKIWCLLWFLRLYNFYGLFMAYLSWGNVRLYFGAAIIHLFKFNDRNTEKRCKICSQLTIKAPERRQWRLPCLYCFKFEQISHLFLVFLLLTLKK